MNTGEWSSKACEGFLDNPNRMTSWANALRRDTLRELLGRLRRREVPLVGDNLHIQQL